MSLKELVFWGWWSVSLWIPLCYFVATMYLFSQSLNIVLRCCRLLLNVIFSCSSARYIRWPGFALIRLSYCCVIDVMLLHCVCCTRLIRIRINVCSVSFHQLLSEFDSPSCGSSSFIRVWSSKVKNVSIFKVFLAGPDSCVMTFPTLCLTPDGQMRLREQSIVGWFPE